MSNRNLRSDSNLLFKRFDRKSSDDRCNGTDNRRGLKFFDFSLSISLIAAFTLAWHCALCIYGTVNSTFFILNIFIYYRCPHCPVSICCSIPFLIYDIYWLRIRSRLPLIRVTKLPALLGLFLPLQS